MAENGHNLQQQQLEEEDDDAMKKLFCSYLGLSLGVFLALAPDNFQALQSQVGVLSALLWQAEEQVSFMTSRLKEDSKAKARAAEIFASHRNAWRAEEKRLLNQIDDAHQEIAHLHARILELEKTQDDSSAMIQDLEMLVEERDDMIGFMATGSGGGPEAEVDGDNHCHRHQHRGKEEVVVYDNAVGFDFDSHLVADTSKLWQVYLHHFDTLGLRFRFNLASG